MATFMRGVHDPVYKNTYFGYSNNRIMMDVISNVALVVAGYCPVL